VLLGQGQNKIIQFTPMSTLRNTVNSQLPVVKWEKQQAQLKTMENKKVEIHTIYTADNLENHSL
jgi:hypothetical protein